MPVCHHSRLGPLSAWVASAAGRGFRFGWTRGGQDRQCQAIPGNRHINKAFLLWVDRQTAQVQTVSHINKVEPPLR